MSNLAVLKQFFDVNWTAKWCTEPTWLAGELKRKHLTGDYIFFERERIPVTSSFF